MFTCPKCFVKLSQQKLSDGDRLWRCRSCQGIFLSCAYFKKPLLRNAWRDWSRLFLSLPLSPFKCPACAQRMRKTAHLDLCKTCQGLWLDEREGEHFFKKSYGQKLKKPPQLLEESDPGLEVYRSLDVEDFFLSLLSVPYEENAPPLKRFPFLTWSLVVVLIAIHLRFSYDFEAMAKTFGFIPRFPLRLGGLTILTSFFIHASWLHLVGNLYFFIVFGDNIEDFFGRTRYLLILLVSLLASSFTSYYFKPDSLIPQIGASGGVFGLVTFYLLSFPRVRIRYVYFIFLRPLVFRLHPLLLLIVLLVIQGFGTVFELAGFSNTAYLAHLGGALGGALMWLLWWPSEKESA